MKYIVLCVVFLLLACSDDAASTSTSTSTEDKVDYPIIVPDAIKGASYFLLQEEQLSFRYVSFTADGKRKEVQDLSIAITQRLENSSDDSIELNNSSMLQASSESNSSISENTQSFSAEISSEMLMSSSFNTKDTVFKFTIGNTQKGVALVYQEEKGIVVVGSYDAFDVFTSSDSLIWLPDFPEKTGSWTYGSHQMKFVEWLAFFEYGDLKVQAKKHEKVVVIQEIKDDVETFYYFGQQIGLLSIERYRGNVLQDLFMRNR